MVQKSSMMALVFAWTMFAGVLGLAAYLILWGTHSSRPTAADLARGEALIRSQYGTVRTQVGRVSLRPAGNCAMRGSAEFVDLDAGRAARQADCVVTIAGRDTFTATCR